MNEQKPRKKRDKSTSKKWSKLDKRIIEFLKQNRGKEFKKKELSKALGITKAEYHLFNEALQNLIRNKRIAKLKGGAVSSLSSLQKIQGPLQLTRKGFGFVTDERTSEDVFISAANLNTALDGDTVEVQLFGVSRGRNKEGRVTRIINRARTRFVGTYHKSEFYGFVVPDNSKVYRDFFIPDQFSMNAKQGQKVVVEMIKWDTDQLNPEGKIVKILGYPDDPGVDVASVVLGHGLDTDFDKALEDRANRMTLDITPEEVARRVDLRDKEIFTIDPPDAKDYDDAISLEILPNGNYQLGVHIADVSHFVKEGDLLDKEAQKRATSIYLVDRVIPMLPEHLSNKLCSLQPHEDRLTYSCIMEVTPKGEVVNYQIVESIIHSKHRFTYQEVQEIIEQPDSTAPFASTIHKMHKLSRILRENRFKNGSIDFSTPEVKFILDEKGFPVDIVPVVQTHSNELVEEFMLLANQTVAKHIKHISGPSKKLLPFIYRVHARPDSEKLSKFESFLNALGYKVKLHANITPKEFQAVLKKVTDSKDEVIIKEVALRTMMKAQYSTVNIGHFGLAFDDYSHFTSPIRRYPDLIAHRLLKFYGAATPSYKQAQAFTKKLDEVCKISSTQERRALDAERESIRIKQIEWLSRHSDQVFEGVISGVTSFGIFVETLPYLIEGLIRIENLSDDFYIFDEKTYTMTGRETGRELRLGDSVKVLVANINRERNEVDFALLEESEKQ
jgi:ribonuclease R